MTQHPGTFPGSYAKIIGDGPRDLNHGQVTRTTPKPAPLLLNAARVKYCQRPMTLHSPTENSLAVLNHKILEVNSQVQNVKLGGHQTCLSINRLWHELCDMVRRLVRTTAPGHHDCSIQE
ncbi:uncharacterized protein TNCV_2553501 [Trichonephila clavipes]|nr:uncharacterized protein TNCV_2553501 [Trichonephila clavipes]